MLCWNACPMLTNLTRLLQKYQICPPRLIQATASSVQARALQQSSCVMAKASQGPRFNMVVCSWWTGGYTVVLNNYQIRKIVPGCLVPPSEVNVPEAEPLARQSPLNGSGIHACVSGHGGRTSVVQWCIERLVGCSRAVIASSLRTVA